MKDELKRIRCEREVGVNSTRMFFRISSTRGITAYTKLYDRRSRCIVVFRFRGNFDETMRPQDNQSRADY